MAVAWNKNNKSDGTFTDALQLNCRVGEFDAMLGKHNLGLMQSSWIHIGWQWIRFQLASVSRSD